MKTKIILLIGILLVSSLALSQDATQAVPAIPLDEYESQLSERYELIVKEIRELENEMLHINYAFETYRRNRLGEEAQPEEVQTTE